MSFKLFIKSDIGVFFVVVILFSLIYVIQQLISNHHSEMMKSSKLSFAILDDVRLSIKADDEIDFHFKDSNGKIVEITNFTHNFDCSNAKKGDTITIKYSLINSEYVDLIHCYYNSKSFGNIPN